MPKGFLSLRRITIPILGRNEIQRTRKVQRNRAARHRSRSGEFTCWQPTNPSLGRSIATSLNEFAQRVPESRLRRSSAISNLIRPGAAVLDVGCTSGYLMAHLQNSKGCRSAGIDLSHQSATTAQNANCRVLIADSLFHVTVWPVRRKNKLGLAFELAPTSAFRES